MKVYRPPPWRKPLALLPGDDLDQLLGPLFDVGDDEDDELLESGP